MSKRRRTAAPTPEVRIADEDELIFHARDIAAAQGKEWNPRLERILRFCARNPGFFPKKRNQSPKSVAEISYTYLSAYVEGYYRDVESEAGLSDIKTKPDPAVSEVLKAFANIPVHEVERATKSHRVSMQAENLIGNLLERYVAPFLESKGWTWCCGETVRAVDFFKDEDSDEPRTLQIKNQENSENSSSSAIRQGTTIEKWFRRNSKSGTTRWEVFPENSESGNDEKLTEEGFYRFINECAAKLKPSESSESAAVLRAEPGQAEGGTP